MCICWVYALQLRLAFFLFMLIALPKLDLRPGTPTIRRLSVPLSFLPLCKRTAIVLSIIHISLPNLQAQCFKCEVPKWFYKDRYSIKYYKIYYFSDITKYIIFQNKLYLHNIPGLQLNIGLHITFPEKE